MLKDSPWEKPALHNQPAASIVRQVPLAGQYRIRNYPVPQLFDPGMLPQF